MLGKGIGRDKRVRKRTGCSGERRVLNANMKTEIETKEESNGSKWIGAHLGQLKIIKPKSVAYYGEEINEKRIGKDREVFMMINYKLHWKRGSS